MDSKELAQEIFTAWGLGRMIADPPSARPGEIDLNTAYGVESEFARLRAEHGRIPVGRKVAFANNAIWQKLNLKTLVWANMYDDTVHYAGSNGAGASETTFSLRGCRAPKIEPELVIKLKRPVTLSAGAGPDSAIASETGVLEAAEWIAIGFEIIDCPFPGWLFKPVDLVAAWGLHTGLVVGAPLAVDSAAIGALVEDLPRFTVKLLKNGAVVEQGSGNNSLHSPARCVAELAQAVARQHGARALAAGELISTGSLTAAQPVGAGETWRVEVEGLPVTNLAVRFT
jgi:2-keto-4-pentenoate hydratase